MSYRPDIIANNGIIKQKILYPLASAEASLISLSKYNGIILNQRAALPPQGRHYISRGWDLVSPSRAKAH